MSVDVIFSFKRICKAYIGAFFVLAITASGYKSDDKWKRDKHQLKNKYRYGERETESDAQNLIPVYCYWFSSFSTHYIRPKFWPMDLA